jgi:hypothetical protein
MSMGDFALFGISFLIFVVGTAALAVFLPIKKAVLRWVAAVTISLIGAAVVGISLYAMFPNKAEAAFKDTFTSIPELKDAELCHASDRGHGPDNYFPWYQVYYLIPDSLEARIKSQAADKGYELQEDTEYIETLKDGTGSTSTNPYDAEDTYLTGKKDGYTVDIRVVHKNSVSITCGGNGYSYGDLVTPSSGKVLLVLSLYAPRN